MTTRIHSRTLIAAALFTLAGAASAQTVLKLGYATSKESHYGVGSAVFCDEMEKGTQGRYKCQQFPNSALGGEREQIEAVQLGTQDIVNTSTGPLGNFVPEVKIVDIPFLFRNYDHARKVMDGPIGQDILKKLQAKGLIGLA
ncbi:TRAP transporter substrate-binding protein DctP, partial [Piscinibacter sp.]|uniref:TRAP transporter substrate-binding protein DctP n=1 Tax=Piscinibacter sp. TaxID=1903157 RepID=UPI00355A3E94